MSVRHIFHFDEQADKIAFIPHHLFDIICMRRGIAAVLDYDMSEERGTAKHGNTMTVIMHALGKPNEHVFSYKIIEKYEDFIEERPARNDFVVLDIMQNGFSGKPETKIDDVFKALDNSGHDKKRRLYFSAFPSFLPSELIGQLSGYDKQASDQLVDVLADFVEGKLDNE